MSKVDSNGMQHNEVNRLIAVSCNMMEQVPVYTRLIEVVCRKRKEVCVRTRFIAMVCIFCETGKYMCNIDRSGMQHDEASAGNTRMIAV